MSSHMGTPANGFRKAANEAPKPERMTVREAVTKWGDNWRLMMPGTIYCHREYMEHATSDMWDFLDMRDMERGLQSRIKVEDILDGE